MVLFLSDALLKLEFERPSTLALGYEKESQFVDAKFYEP